MQCFAVGSARKGSVFSSSSRFFLSLSLSANMFVVMWLGLHRGSAGLVLESQRGVEVESVSLLCPSSSFSARVCSSRGPVCQLDLTVVCLVKSSFPVGQSRSTSGSPIWRRVRPRICGFVILGPRFCGGAFGSGQPHGLHLGPARDCYSWSGVGCVCLFDFRCGGAALLGGSSSSIKTRLWLASKKRAAVKKKRDAAKRSETTEKKRKRDSGLDGGSSSNPTKRAQNRVRETAASPPEHQGVHSPTPAAKLPSQGDSEGSSIKSPSHRVDDQNGEEIGSNNRDSNAPEVAVDNDTPRTVNKSI
ncbi:unnamed protein product [Brassica oleracea var. botrytis]|uniref:(rape) hypothetical protein n=1 Tax=Brassica napus TaxID=3708 RepID=A0A816J420_BRANA|nr:unnamed protein product [Brassica napus]